ncbi:MAG: acetylpolyamine amidohydrolase [Nitrospirota bacterium]|nr:acetylpolyamine amidohydrolase [Nitrospirota bacterium]
MIRFRYLFGIGRDLDRRQVEEAQDIYRRCFPYAPEYADRIGEWLARSPRRDLEPILLLALGARAVIGFSWVMYFPDLRYAYLDYLASDPGRSARGIGGALYEATREVLQQKGARGLFLEAPHDDPELLKDPSRAPVNHKRMLFYERYGALPVVGTAFDRTATTANEGWMTHLVYDSLGRRAELRGGDARNFVGALYRRKYGLNPDNKVLSGIIASFRDGPVKLRQPKKGRDVGGDAGDSGDAASRPAKASASKTVKSPAKSPAKVTAKGASGKASATKTVKSPAKAPAAKATKGTIVKPPVVDVVRRIYPVKLVTNERHFLHHMREKGYVERPVRMDAVLRGLEGLAVEQVRPHHFGEAPIRAVHAASLIGYMARASSRLQARQLIYPTVFPMRRRHRPPREFEMRAGYYCLDTFTPLGHNTYAAARSAVDTALTGANLALDGERYVYALCRPPGHHAEPNAWGGFCYFNNASVAAHHLSAHGKVALLDIDHHHGNGSQQIFYQRNDVLVVNLHCHPDFAYPYFSGFADERGEGAGKGFNRNYPLPPGTGDKEYLKALAEALRDIARFKPEFFVVSVGYDIMRGDPTGSFAVTSRGMRKIGEQLAALRLPTLLVQEGGYSLSNLRQGSRAFITGLTSIW